MRAVGDVLRMLDELSTIKRRAFYEVEGARTRST
jgi:hypothetical protein